MRQPVWGVQLKGGRRQRRGDRVVKYHRATGIRLPDLPETHPDFVAAWAAAEAGGADPLAKAARVAPVAIGSLSASIRAEQAGRDWKSLSAVYRSAMKREFDAMSEAYGKAQTKAIRPKHIEADLAKLSDGKANTRLKAWRRVMAGAKRRGEIEVDPSIQVKRRIVKSEGFPAWSAAEIASYRERWPIGTTARAAFELVFWTAARTIDAVTLGPRNIDHDGVLIYRQSKVGKPAHVPWNSVLPAFASGWAVELSQVKDALQVTSGGFTFLEANGKVRSVKGLGNLIAESARTAGISKSAHGLRKSRLTAIAEAGGTAHAIMAWGGHQTLQEAERYTRAAQLKKLVMGDEHIENSVSLEIRDTKTAKT
ncbi:tyrosine-type recombinase/integrase [Rhodovulum sulfidophilum]|nr:tyrosine-type recombinase/integrase [Rhodovulum sulfidophilum]MBL3597700.1 tyrosine-type recombinase/integrase [Rhodovulum sulfidophilum]